MSGNSSGQNFSPRLDPGIGQQQNPGAAIVFDGNLYYIGNGHNNEIWVISRSLDPDSLDLPDTNESSYWTQNQLDTLAGFNPANIPGYNASTNQQTAAAIAGGNLYFVWIQPDNTVWATQLLPGAGPTGWSQPVRLCDSGSDILTVSGSNFAVTGWGDYLVACYNVGGETVFRVYDTNDLPALPQVNPVMWNAATTWSQFFPFWQQIGNQISMDWFTTAGTPPTSNGPAIHCIVSLFNGDTGTAYVLHLINVLPIDQWQGANQPCETWEFEEWTGLQSSVDIVRDPAGRMRAYYSNSQWLVAVRVLSTDFVSGWNPFGQETLLYPENGTNMAANMAPAAAFVIGAPQTGTTTNETVLPVYEFVLFTEADHIYLAFSQFGKAVQIVDAYQMPFDTVVPQDEQKLILTGLVDSPQPMPAVNVKSRPSPYPSQTVGSITYGTTATTGESHSTNWSWSAGIMSSGKAKTGVGLAWNISFQAGTSGATGGSSATQLGTQLIAQTNLASLTEKALSLDGALFAAAVVYHRNEYQFYDLSLYGSIYTLATNAPQITAVWIEYTGRATQAFNAYANTVGNVWSYTRDGWNARMRQLGYPGDKYFEEVIAVQDSNGNYVNAVAFPGGPCLNFAWSPDGDILQNFNAVDTTFTESGWHLSASAYVGISWALGAEVFGLGEEVMGELLVGGSYSRTTQEKTTDGNSWGITVTYTLQDPPSQVMQMYPGEVIALSWNLWLLKANSQWTQELINYGGLLPDTIDPGSEPWRIVFEVVPESVLFRGDNKNLVYRDSNGDVIEAWYSPAYSYRYGPPEPTAEEGGSWGWTNLTKVATQWKAPAVGCHPVGVPCWFAWGLSEPGYRPYTQAVAFRTSTDEIHLLLGSQWPVTSTTPPPDNTQWQLRNLMQKGFVNAKGDPVGYHWRDQSGEAIHLFYRGVDGNIHELSAEGFDEQWSSANLTGSCPHAQKPASDPCAIVWEEDPAGQSEHVFYRANDGKIYGLACGKQWTLTNLSEVTRDGGTPEGKPSAYVWNGSLHVGYRGATGEIHELRFEDGKWQQADDPSWDAHATAPEQRAAAAPVHGFAWERRMAPQSIHWFYITVDNTVAELYRFDGAANSWGWNNLSEQARGDGNSGQMPPVDEILQANVWYFDPVHGSSMELYLRDKNGSIFELRYTYVAPDSEDGAWSWTELTGLPTAAVSGQLTDGRSAVQIGAAAAQ